MKSKVQVAAVFLLSIAAFNTSSGSVGAKDGGGPMCFPGTGCGVTGTNVANVALEPIRRLLIVAKDGGGPMCFPGTGCGYR